MRSDHPNQRSVSDDPFAVATHIRVDVALIDVPDDLCEFILSEPYATSFPEDAANSRDPLVCLHASYEDLGERVLDAAVDLYNRFVGHVRTEKMQHWLRERSKGRAESEWEVFNSLVSDSDGTVRVWRPRRPGRTRIYAPVRSGIREDDWPRLSAATTSERRPELIDELGANSLYLAEIGLYRSALIEAVSSLEVAVSRFAARPRVEALSMGHLREWFSTEPLAPLISRLGLTATVTYLLPLLIPEAVLPDETLKGCSEGVLMRHSLVHTGSRAVTREQVGPSLGAIYRTCVVLKDLTISRSRTAEA